MIIKIKFEFENSETKTKGNVMTSFNPLLYIVHFAALDCYACSYLDGYSDTFCLNNASAVRVINCTKKYCVTVRQELLVSVCYLSL